MTRRSRSLHGGANMKRTLQRFCTCVVAALGLGGCWQSSTGLFDESQAVQPFAEGTYLDRIGRTKNRSSNRASRSSSPNPARDIARSERWRGVECPGGAFKANLPTAYSHYQTTEAVSASGFARSFTGCSVAQTGPDNGFRAGALRSPGQARQGRRCGLRRSHMATQDERPRWPRSPNCRPQAGFDLPAETGTGRSSALAIGSCATHACGGRLLGGTDCAAAGLAAQRRRPSYRPYAKARCWSSCPGPSRFLAVAGLGVDGRPGAPLGFLFAGPALLVTFLDVLGLTLLQVAIARLVAAGHSFSSMRCDEVGRCNTAASPKRRYMPSTCLASTAWHDSSSSPKRI